MPGAFVISFDCEGKWGMADHLDKRHSEISQQNLLVTYAQLVKELDERKLLATFAFVGMFTLTDKERKIWEPAMPDAFYNGSNWSEHYRSHKKRHGTDGWFCPEALDIVLQSGRHEVACHGFTHLPFDANDTPVAALDDEIICAREIAQQKGIQLKTFVFPRNKPGRVGTLASNGFLGYRDSLDHRSSRVGRIWSELNVYERSHPHSMLKSTLCPVPPGFFLNWRKGVRASIPGFVTLRRWKNILDDAAANGKVAHLWLHPHNLITSPATFSLLRKVLDYVRHLVEKQLLVTETQVAYAKKSLNSKEREGSSAPRNISVEEQVPSPDHVCGWNRGFG